jgi:hypothetical protein
MTENPTWHPPGDAIASEPPVPAAGPAEPGASARAHAAEQPAAAPPPVGWAPPPRPGLFPLRPLDFGTVFGTTFRVLRRNPRPVFGVAIALTALATFIAGALVTVVALVGVERITRAAPDDADAIMIGTGALILLSGLVAAGLSVVAGALLQGVVAIEVASASLGERLTAREIWARGRGRWGALVGWALLLSLALTTAVVILVTVIVVMVTIGDAGGVLAGLGAGVLGGLALAAVAVWLWITLAFVPSALVLERRTLGAAIGRSWSLVRGRFWRTLGILLLLVVVVQTATTVITAPFSLATSFAGPLLNPAGAESTDLGLVIGMNLIAVALSAVVGAVGAVLVAAGATLLYIDARMRTEGLDLELQRAVESRAQGATADDPYLPPRS